MQIDTSPCEGAVCADLSKMNKHSEFKALKRKAWGYQKKKLPSLYDFLSSAQGRRQFFRAWLINPISHISDLVGHYLLKLLPIDISSSTGSWLGWLVMRYKYPKSVANMHHNLEVIHPDWSSAEIGNVVKRNSENLGRFMSEFSVIDRICADFNRVKVTGFDKLMQAANEGPVILVTLHLGNWEILPSLTRRFGLQFHTFFLPLSNPIEAWIAYRTRKRLGAQLLPLAMDGVRPALRILKKGGVVALFCDEGFAGQIRGPFLGRKPHLSGNAALAIRLAKLSGAKLCLVYSERVQGAYFNCHFEPIVALPERPTDGSHSNLVDEVLALNGVIESAIIKHIDQWYFLNNKL